MQRELVDSTLSEEIASPNGGLGSIFCYYDVSVRVASGSVDEFVVNNVRSLTPKILYGKTSALRPWITSHLEDCLGNTHISMPEPHLKYITSGFNGPQNISLHRAVFLRRVIYIGISES